jgi:hypothetical protein
MTSAVTIHILSLDTQTTGSIAMERDVLEKCPALETMAFVA